MMNEGISVADALALRNTGMNGNGSDGFGSNGQWWVIILILFFAVGGWGRGFGNNGSGADGSSGYNACCIPATAQGVTDAFNFSQLDNGVRGLERGMCDGFYTTARDINGVTAAVKDCCCETQQNLNQLNTAILQSGFQTQTGITGIGTQLQSCCCDIERGQDAIKCQISDQMNSVLVASDKNTDRIINYLTQTEMDKLRTELQSAQFQLSQLSQTSNIINQLKPVPNPAYLVSSPYSSVYGVYGYGYNNGCGCGASNGCGCCA